MAMDQSARKGGIAAMLVGGLVVVALVGPTVWDGLWLALAPAAALVILAARELHAAWRPRDGRLGAVGAFVLATGSGALLALMVIGMTATASLGMEPAWLALLQLVAGYIFLAGAALFGAAALRTGPRWAGVAFAVSLPLGLGVDAATSLFPFGDLFFFAGFGFYLGLGLFAVSLARIGFAARARARVDSSIG